MTSIRRPRWKPLVACLSICLLALSGCNPARSGKQEKFELRFAHVTSTGTPKGLAADYFAKQIEEKSDGRIQVEVFPNSELYGDKDEMQALQSNAVQMLAPASAKFTTIAPSLQVLDLPFIFDEPDEIPDIVSPETEIGKAIYANPDLEANGLQGSRPVGLRNEADPLEQPNALAQGHEGQEVPDPTLRTYCAPSSRPGAESHLPWHSLRSTTVFSRVSSTAVRTRTRTLSRRRCIRSRST